MPTLADDWIAKGIELGIGKEYEQAIKQGIEQGRIQVRKEAILDLVSFRLGLIEEAITELIMTVDDPDALRQLLRRAALADTNDAFLEFLAELESSRQS